MNSEVRLRMTNEDIDNLKPERATRGELGYPRNASSSLPSVAIFLFIRLWLVFACLFRHSADVLLAENRTDQSR